MKSFLSIFIYLTFLTMFFSSIPWILGVGTFLDFVKIWAITSVWNGCYVMFATFIFNTCPTDVKK